VLNPTREPTEDEKQLIQDLVMEVYNKFVGIVAERRKMKVEDLKSGLADGRILSGKQAVDAGFVDSLGNFNDAVEKAKELADIKGQKVKVVRYFQPLSLRNLLRFLGQADHKPQVSVDIIPNKLKLEAGKLYFLPAYMFQ